MSQPLTAAVLDSALQAWLPRAQAGDFLAMAYVAILRHLSGDNGGEGNNWLRRALVDEDADFLIALGEELVIGTALPRNLQLARDCFQRALALSEMKGCYATARFLVGTDRKRAEQLFIRAAALGHLPSRHLVMFLRLPKRRLVRLIYRLRHAPRLFLDARTVFSEAPGSLRWWRYKDVFAAPDNEMQQRLGEDRKCYFPWALPSSLAAFARAVTKADHSQLPRGDIDADALMPHPEQGTLPTPAAPLPTARPLSPWVRTPISIAFVALFYWLASHFSSGLATVPTLRNVPPKADIEVAMHLKDGSGIFETMRPDDFTDGTAERTVQLSEPPLKAGEPSRGVFLTLHNFEGSSGSASLGVMPFGWTDAPLTVRIADYQHCGTGGNFGPIADIRICTQRTRKPASAR
ncbi:MAG TPA: hypothetical protein VNX47_03255 [Nevskia sp.]|nr:hypothetical protein [Nevskia sp.]